MSIRRVLGASAWLIATGPLLADESQRVDVAVLVQSSTSWKRVVRTSEAVIEQVGAEHRGFTDDEPCVVIVTYAGTPGMPRSVASPGEESGH